jgi:hypothetical protein
MNQVVKVSHVQELAGFCSSLNQPSFREALKNGFPNKCEEHTASPVSLSSTVYEDLYEMKKLFIAGQPSGKGTVVLPPGTKSLQSPTFPRSY